ncbi:ankyrin, putative [Plasmodium knowlesi strain H]|uniref:Ankyrin, putative n=3 Tax=Plasmodium knowlesi TaxID=5850 RepID=A0A5K1UPN3_PLAKH|nr:ankyrin-repeat protein, putative [Plasmodium knowlesi strain H]OTN63963.1 putative Ankyrin [Plasmodium knowlesi]CAA9990745.1 ankyrin-repeat protein, putative [Plasmodium knowlesi strain H]SBO21168.1 ankyrin, putative [Plasmodium knowlesi strain H]SBO21626.1 ankyrin, putative [Plasmodium knowlesi strain H]VVS80219.1 ankyrin-repeat protein, putative [Plasmodium knowlesi strain H]|eukprot:XP_002262034.1 Ankyrin, putative [Plasmodium knowlesi strain H]
MSSKVWKAILKDDVVKFKNSIESEGDVNLNSYNKEGLTLLLLGIEKGCGECCHYLVNECNVNIFLKDKKEKDNALMKCMVLGHDMINLSRLLIEKKIDVNEKNKNGKTSLHVASEYNYVKGIELLIKNHAHINALDNENNTPLMCSIKRSKEEAAILLIEKGADVNIKDRDMNSVLHICAKEHLGNIAQSILLTQKVDIKNCLDNENNSPLHIAAKENQKGLCELFLKHKFDGCLKNNNNETYEDILKKNEKNDILKEEEKKKNYQEKEIRKRKNYEEAMLKTDVSNFLKIHNLESLAPHFYKHNYVYVDQAFLDVNDSTLKKMNLSKEERKLFYEAVDKHYSQIEDEQNEQELVNRQLQEEQRRTKRLKLVSYVVSLIFTAIFIYSLVISILKRGRIFF